MKVWQANTLILFAAIFFGLGFVATDVSIQYMSPLQMQAIRFCLSSLICLVIFYKKWTKASKASIIKGCLIGVAYFFAITAQNYGLESTTVPKNAFITVTNMAWVPLIGWLLFKKKPAAHIWYGIILMLIGFAFLIFDIDIFNLEHSLANLESQMNLTFGDFLTLVCSFGFAIHLIISDLFVQDEDPITLLIFQLITSSVLSLVFTYLVDGSLTQIPLENFKAAFLPILFMAIFPTICSFGFMLVAQQYVSASNVAIICSTESLFATLFAIILGNTPFASSLLIGGVIITIGIIWAETGFKFKQGIDTSDVNKNSI